MLQVKFLIVGLLLAGAFVGYQWLDDLPGIPPVRLPAPLAGAPVDAAGVPIGQPEPREPVGSLGLPDAVVDEPPPVTLPILNDSDDWVRQQLADTPVPWLVQTELVRTSATVLENAARGEVPRRLLDFLTPQGKFATNSDGGRVVADAASFVRYDGFVASLTSLPAVRAAQLFGLVEPLLSEALRELGGDATGKVATPRELAHAALGVALATPEGVIDAALVRPKVVYKYADETLEKLLPLQKQLLRMGPANLQKVLVWLRNFRAALSPGLTPVVPGGAPE